MLVLLPGFFALGFCIGYGGLFGVPSTSMRNALADMMRTDG